MLGYALNKCCWVSQLLGTGQQAGPAQSKLVYTIVRDKVPIVHLEIILRKPLWVIPDSGRGKCICGTAFNQGWTSQVVQKDEEVHCVPQRDLILDENSKLITVYSVNYYKILYIITSLGATSILFHHYRRGDQFWPTYQEYYCKNHPD